MNEQKPRSSRTPGRIALIVFAVAAGYYLWAEHRAQLLGWLPLLLPLGVCLGMHLFMHRGHGGHGGRRNGEGYGRDP